MWAGSINPKIKINKILSMEKLPHFRFKPVSTVTDLRELRHSSYCNTAIIVSFYNKQFLFFIDLTAICMLFAQFSINSDFFSLINCCTIQRKIKLKFKKKQVITTIRVTINKQKNNKSKHVEANVVLCVSIHNIF